MEGHEMTPIPAPGAMTPGGVGREDARRLVAAFLSGRNELTIRAYGRDLADFAAFLGVRPPDEAARELLSRPHGAANALALSYRTSLVERRLSPATVNRRLAAVRSLVSLARTLGLVPWSLEVPGLRAQAYRDVRGPGREALDRVLARLAKRTDRKSIRDRSILRTLHDLALRRGEVVTLDLEHVDQERGVLWVLGKRRTARQALTLPPQTRDALAAWIRSRGAEPGPLFPNLDRARKGGRLTGTSLYRLVKGHGLGRPHGLRHLAVTEALDVTNGNVRMGRAFSRHADANILLLYDDARADMFGEVARRVAAGE